MRVIEVRPARPGGATIGHVDIEAAPGIRLYGLRVSRAENGTFRVFGLSNDHGRTCAFSHEAADDIAKATIKFMTVNGTSNHDRLAS